MADLKKVFSKRAEWSETKAALSALHQKGFEAVLAGGCVRDALLGKPPKDFDIATAADPEEILELFPKADGRWKHFGVIFAPLKSQGRLEITSFRKEGSYKDGRRPSSVAKASGLREDALRRDFTVNALFYDFQKDLVIDWTGGQKDLKDRLLRTVGKAEERFNEDFLRPLRALRFAHQLQFRIEEKTAKALPAFAGKLQTLSKERIYSELVKTFSCGRLHQAERIFFRFGFFKALFPFADDFVVPPDLFYQNPFSFFDEPSFMWAVFGLPYFFRKPFSMSDFLLQEMRADRDTAGQAACLIHAVKTLSGSSLAEKMQAFSFYGSRKVLELAEAFEKTAAKAQSEPSLTVGTAAALFQEFQARADKSGKLPPPIVDGGDLLSRGLSPGKGFGRLLNKAYNFQIEKNLSSKEEVLRLLFPPTDSV